MGQSVTAEEAKQTGVAIEETGEGTATVVTETTLETEAPAEGSDDKDAEGA